MRNIKITKREILFSVTIVVAMLIIGLFISEKIAAKQMDKYQEYNTAVRINNDNDLFKYGMSTNIGNAFVYGELKAVDTVSYDEISGEYSYVKKVKERYTKHTRIVTKSRTNSKGETEYYEVEEDYYTWDYISSEDKHSETIQFIDTKFSYGTIAFPSSRELDIIYVDGSIFHSVGDIRYVYYGAVDRCEGTLYAILKDDTVLEARLYYDQDIDKTINKLESSASVVAFWIAWVFLTVILVFGFYFIDNRWLEDSGQFKNKE